MTRVHVLSAYPDSRSNCVASFLRASAAQGPPGEFALATEPARADLIIFAEAHPGDDPLFYRVALHPIRRRYPGKCVLYSDTDHVLPLMRGLFPSLAIRDADPARFRGAAYYGQVEENPFVAPLPPSRAHRLATFAGARTHPLRSRLLELLGGRPEFQLRDTTGQRSWTLSHEEKAAYQRCYAEELAEASFVLCPRGVGPSSYRLYEAMKAARCPVIIADAWTPPAGPQWEECSVRVDEQQIACLPDLLASLRGKAPALGERARSAWEHCFSPAVAFQRLAAQGWELLQAGASARYHWEELARPSVWRPAVRGALRQRRKWPELLAGWIRA